MIKKSGRIDDLRIPISKRLIFAASLIAMILFPDYLLHLLAVLAHTLYESIAFAVEELLTHVFGLTKFQAQMSVFYGSCTVGALIAYRCSRSLPFWLTRLKAQARLRYETLRAKAIERWELLPAVKKIQFLLFQFAVVAGSVGFMLS